METRVGTIRKIFEGGRLIVPPYQRGYSWEEKSWADIWEDVVEQYRAVSRNEKGTHFLGAVVYGEGKTRGPLAKTEYDIIDGQQRLTTVSILLAAIRDELIDDDVIRRGISESYLVFPAVGNEDEQLRVVPGRNDKSIFESIINTGSSGSGSSHRIIKAYRFFRQQLHRGVPPLPEDPDIESDSSAPPTDSSLADVGNGFEASLPSTTGVSEHFNVDQLLATVLDRLELVSISEVPAEDAYQVFRTINSTGTELDQVDLLRNAFFILLPREGPRAFEEIWRPMEDLLTVSLEEFFHTDLLRLGDNIPRDQVYRAQTKRLRKSVGSETAILAELTAIGKRASVYSTLRYSDPPLTLNGRSLPKPAMEILFRLRDWGADTVFPLVLECGLRWQSNNIGDSTLTDLLSSVESLLVRRYIANEPPNDLRSSFATLMTAVQGQQDFGSAVKAQLKAERRRWKSNDQIRKACIELPFYRRKRQDQLILRRLAISFEGKEHPNIRFGKGANDYSIEHVMPQHLTDQWFSDLKMWGDEPTVTHSEKRDVIGNLTITAYNSELSDQSFADKQEFIRNNLQLRLSKQILSTAKWNAAAIDERSRELAEKIIELWPE